MALCPPNTSLASLEMDLELWKEHRIVIATFLLIIVHNVYKRSQPTSRPPVVSYVIPWIGSALELGKTPDAFFKRAMYVDHLFMRLKA